MHQPRDSRACIKQLLSLGMVITVWANVICLSADASGRSKPPTQATGQTQPSPAPTSVPISTAPANTAPASSARKDEGQAVKAQVAESYGNLPLRFEANLGQTDAQVRFLARGAHHSIFLTPTETVMVLSGPAEHEGKAAGRGAGRKREERAAVLRMKLAGANERPHPVGLEELSEKSNYFIGNDPKNWRTNVPAYSKVQYEGVYPGVDVVYYGNQRQLEYDFVVAPGADARVIKLNFEGARRLRIDGNGDLVLVLNKGEVRQSRPVIYQNINGHRREVAGRYVLKGQRAVGFEIKSYDGDYPLVIDPVLSYSTYLGGLGSDEGTAIAVDAAGNAYVTGVVFSTFPTTATAFQSARGGKTDAFITKLNATGTAFVYSTYLGGLNDDRGLGITVDAEGNAYVTGYTNSSNFPKANALQTTYGGNTDAFVTKLDATGAALAYSTLLGGSGGDRGNAIAVDSAGNACVMGSTASTNFPTANPLQPTYGGATDAFVTKLDATGTAFVYSTYLGGSGGDFGERGVTMDAAGNTYVTGVTNSTNFPTANPLQPTFGGGPYDLFITKLDTTGAAAVYSTYLGGADDDRPSGIKVDSSGNVYIGGMTNGATFPTANALQPSFGGFIDAFALKLNAAGTALLYSTYLGGDGDDRCAGFTIDGSGNAYLTGYTYSTNFPTVIPLQAAQSDNGSYYDAFVSKLSPAGNALVFSSFIGSAGDDKGSDIAVDAAGNAYITGYTFSTTFPVVNAAQPTLGGNNDAFVLKISGLTRYAVSGRVTDAAGGGLGAVSVTVSGTESYTTQTNANGEYAIASLAPGGNFTITPSKSPYLFVPASRSFTNLSGDQVADFSIQTYDIGGQVTDSGGNGVEAATLTLDGFQTGTTRTDASGYYSFIKLPAGGAYTVTPSKDDPLLTYNFTPSNRSYSSLSGNQSANFTAGTSTLNVLYPTADAYVQDGTSAAANFGAVTPLKLQTDTKTNTGKNIDAYLRFDLSGIGAGISSAKLRISAALSAAGSVSTSAYTVSNNTWVESGNGSITWNNKPARNATAISGATATVTSTSYAAYDIDITSYIKSEKTAGRDVVSLALHNPSASTPFINLSSREDPGNRPQLVVTMNAGTNAAPSVALTSPAVGASYTAPANITVSANAGDSDGSISKVEFFAGTTLIGTASAAPYQINWTNVAAGTYSLTAVATDNSQATTSSSAVSVTVNPQNVLPAVSLVSPMNNTTFPARSNISVSANASDSDGSISKVEFFAGTTLIGTTTAPATGGTYNIAWNNVASGAYALTAKATDSAGGATTSNAVNINVVSQTGLSPTADAYVKDGTSASTNFGTATELQTQVSATAGSNRESYLKFDLTAVGGIVNARVRLYGRLSDTTGSNIPAAIYPVSSTTWTESGSGSITWSTKPAAGTTALATTTVTDNVARWYEWDVTAYVKSEKSAGRNVISLAVKNTSTASPFTTFNSREAAANAPQLVLWTTQPRDALLVVGSATLNTGDTAIKTRLINLGYTVTVKAAGSTTNTAVNTSDANGKSLVVISSTVTPANVGTKFRGVAVPVVVWEFDLLDDLGMTGTTSGTDYGTAATQTQLSILNATHPMAAGLSGTVTAVTAAGSFTWGKPNTNALKIAALTTDSTKVVIFGYDGGATMSGLEAPARRVGTFLTDTTAASLTTSGGSLFDAAVNWATEVITAPTISSLTPGLGPVATSVTIKGYNFGSSQGSGTITFNGVAATPTSWSDKSIVTTVPAYATTGAVIVTVNGVASNGMTFAVGETDTDGDGLPDSWEVQFFGNLNQSASADPDGDGLTNLQEYRQGRNPTKSAQTDAGDFVNLKVHTPLAPVIQP